MSSVASWNSWLRASVAKVWKEDRRLHCAASKRWSKQQIIDAIQRRRQEGKQVNYSATRRDDSALVSAARRYFGNWSKALLAAGVDAER